MSKERKLRVDDIMVVPYRVAEKNGRQVVCQKLSMEEYLELREQDGVEEWMSDGKGMSIESPKDEQES